MRLAVSQHLSETVRYTLPEIITLRWQACAAAMDGQSAGALLPI